MIKKKSKVIRVDNSMNEYLEGVQRNVRQLTGKQIDKTAASKIVFSPIVVKKRGKKWRDIV